MVIHAFVRGINAYIKNTEQHPELLPLEFRLFGINPQPWTPEVVVSRLGGLFLNLEVEVSMASRVRLLGADMSKWTYGQEQYHHITIRHMLNDAIKPTYRNQFDVGPLPALRSTLRTTTRRN